MEVKGTDHGKFAYLLISVYLLVYGVILLKPLLVPLFFAGLFATLFVPVANFLEKWRINRAISTMLSLFIALIVLGGVVYIIQWQLSGLVDDLPELGSRLTEKLSEIQLFVNEKTPFKINLQTSQLKDSVVAFAQENSTSFSKIIFSLLGGVTVFILIPVYVFLFLLYREFLHEFIIKLFEKSDSQYIIQMTEKVQKVSQNYIRGVFVVAIILSVINSIVLMIFGIKHAVFFGVLAGFLNSIPYVGPLFGALMPILMAWLTKDSVWYPLGIFISFFTVQTIEGYFLTPRIVGKSVDINPLIVIIALISGYFIWGVIGMILVVPVVAVLKILFDQIDFLKPIGFLIGGIPEKQDLSGKMGKLKRK
jgi:predicted PurR-regulated permease PerM